MDNEPRTGVAGRHRWVFEILSRAGAVPEGEQDGIHTYRLTNGLAGFLDRDRLQFTFRKRLAFREGVELASPGSWLHDQLLRFAQARGRITLGHLPAREDLDRDAVLGRRTAFRERLRLREKRYGTILTFTFHLSIYSEPPEETILSLSYDCQRGRVLTRAVGKRTFLEATEEPREEYAPPARPRVRDAFRAVWEAVQQRVEDRVLAIEHEGRQYLANELDTLERYYRQLIAEEKRIEKSRSSRRGQAESRKKVDLLKLEWERRVKEETERLKPQVIGRLSAVALVRVPMERWVCAVEMEGKRVRRDYWIDLVRGETWAAAARRGKTTR